MKVLVFAALREMAGGPEVEVDVTDVGSLLDELSSRFGPRFDSIMAAGTVLVDGAKAGRGRELRGGEEVALLPPVSGGQGARDPAAGRGGAWFDPPGRAEGRMGRDTV